MPRIVNPDHGLYASMGYSFRCRIDSREFRTITLRKRTMFRCVIERSFMAWEDFEEGPWRKTIEIAEADGNRRLDELDVKHNGARYL